MPSTVETSIEEYRGLKERLPGHELPWLAGLRDAAAQRFAERGWPTSRDEAWKYTNIAPVVRKGYAPIAEADVAAEIDATPWLLPGLDGIRLVFVDGHHVPGLSSVAGLPDGVIVTSLKAGLRDAPGEIERWLADAPAAADAFADLNTAFMTDGAVVRVPAGATLDRPIHLLYIARESSRPCAAFVRDLVLVGAGARATVIQHHVSVDGAQSLINGLTRCVLDDGAALEHYRLNEQGDGLYHFSAVQLRQGRDSRYVSHDLQLGARLARGELLAELAGEGCECTLNGFYLGRGRRHIDNYTRVEHQVPHCSSRQLYKGVLSDNARGIFNGHLIVCKDAQKTDAQQMNRNLLLSEQAEADTRPQLEIYADDVKCSHGATVGQIDADALFYLRARGLDDVVARRLLIGAFAGEITGQLTPAPLRLHVERLVAAQMSE